MSAMRYARRAALLLALLAWPPLARAQTIDLPNKDGSVRFAVMGDTGRGDAGQLEMAKMMEMVHAKFPFTFMVMVGDNIYGADTPGDYEQKFEKPYKPLMDAGVKFYAALGNHDNPNQRFYKQFNMNGERFYTFRASPGGLAKLTTGGVRFFAIDSNYLDKSQLDWLSKELAASGSEWKICFFHHPLYSSGATHGSALETRAVLEPMFVKDGVSVVLTGHDHIYERIKLQKGIQHFVVGSGGSLRRGDLRQTDMTAKGFDQDYAFMIAEIDADEMHYQAISRKGTTIDSGVIKRVGAGVAAAASPAPAAASAKETKTEPVAAAPSPSPSPEAVAAAPSPAAASKAASKPPANKKRTPSKKPS